jgi:hypothetical protein
MEITSWAAWRSLRLRGYEPRDVGVYAISLRCVRQVMGGRDFRPLQSRGDRSWADSLFNKRNGRIKTNLDDWQISGRVEGEQEESDLMADWSTWKATLGDDDKELVAVLEAGDTQGQRALIGDPGKL